MHYEEGRSTWIKSLVQTDWSGAKSQSKHKWKVTHKHPWLIISKLEIESMLSCTYPFLNYHRFYTTIKQCYKHQHCECSGKSCKSESGSIGSLAEVNIRTSEYVPIYLQLFFLLPGFCYVLLYDNDGLTYPWILKSLCNHISFWPFSLHIGLNTQKDAKRESETASRELAMESH